ncbi:MAG: autotransporter outer membrane beta-barrel domain-containing protein [Porphyrobacter sp.]|nr:autotransporter outer membrane beta-barrel domain-containing protein [Porphyrobacter sp.]
MNRSSRTSALVTTMLTAILPGAALGATQVTSDSSVPLATSSAGDITITNEAELGVTGSNPITVDSNNSVTIDEDASVEADDSDGRAGISVQAGRTFVVQNDGTIQVLEDFVPADTDANGIADGAIAEASNRYGVRVMPGATSSGTISNSGTIDVEGLSSRGISVESNFVGDIVNTGSIAVQGDYSIGLETASVDGDVTIDGTVAVVGEGTQGAVLGGDISGTLSIQGAISKAASFTDDNGNSRYLSRADLRVANPVVSVGGSVAGGILIEAPPYDLNDADTDEDDDGVTDSSEATGSIDSVGESPALLIGGATDVSIGGVQGRDGVYSLAVDGTIYSTAYYSAFDSTGVVIGGQGGAVDLPYGIGVSGSIQAATVDSSATALLINQGVYVPSLSNSGTIRASVSSSGEAEVWAIRDLSGTLSTIDNSGHIQAAGSNEDLAIAIDLQANTTGVTINQYLNDIDAATKAEEEADEDYDPNNASIYTSITGDILLGSGSDLLQVSSGWIYGDTYLGSGNDRIVLLDEGNYLGTVHAGTDGFSMSVSDTASFQGTIDANGLASELTISGAGEVDAIFENADQFTVDVQGGRLIASQNKTAEFGNLNVASGGAIAVIVDGEEGTASSFVVGNATFADGSHVQAEVTSLANAAGTYRILTADTLTGLPTLDLDADLPIVLGGEMIVGTNTLDLTIELKTAEQLGLTSPQSAAYQAIIAATANSSTLEQSLLQVDDVPALQAQINTLLPDYAGGVFDLVTRASRMAAKHVSDNNAIYEDFPTGVWLEPIYFRGSKDAGATAGFATDGKGISGGFESNFGFGYLGVSATYTQGGITNGDLYTLGTEEDDNLTSVHSHTIDANIWELAGHWRLRTGPLYSFARISASRASLSSTRAFIGSVDGTDTTLTSTGEWKGVTYSAMAGASYSIALGQHFTLSPTAHLEYFRLDEDGYGEDGGGAIDLVVEDRKSEALFGTTSLTGSYRFGQPDPYATPLTLEFEGGWRSVLSGELGETVAAFDGVDTDSDGDNDTAVGQSFTLMPDSLKGGWFTETRIRLGGYGYTWQLGVGAEQTQGDVDLSARFSFSLGF